MPKVLTTKDATLTTTYRITSYRVDVGGPSLYVEGEVERRVGDETFTGRFNCTVSDEVLATALADAEARIRAGASYYVGTRDALYVLLQAHGVISSQAQ